jgi:hypothetical protein
MSYHDQNNDTLSIILSKRLRDTLESMIGDVLAPVESHAGSFIYIEADSFQAKFLCVNADGVEASTELVERLDPILTRLRHKYDQRASDQTGTPENPHRRLFEMIAELAEESQLTKDELRAVAFHWLRNRGLTLGNTAHGQGGSSQTVTHWSFSKNPRPMLRVQDSLDWAATFNSNLASMGCERGDIGLYSSINSTVLKIPMSAARHNLVTGNNFEVFLAEHIVALDDDSLSNPEALRDLKSPSLTFYMLPIRGLGQWRAAIDWIERRTGNDDEAHDNALGEELRKQSSKLSKAALEELLSLSLTNIFAHSVRRSLAPFQFNLDRQREKLCEAFGLLWFSKEIRFFKDGICLDLWRRDPHTSQLVSSKELAKGVTLAQADWEQIGGNYPGFFLCDKNRHPQLTTIRLNLNPIIQSLKLQTDDAAILKSDSPYDAVEYECYFFDADKREIQRWADGIGDRLHRISVEQNLRRMATDSDRAEIYEEIAHGWKGLLTLAGLADSRNTLRECIQNAGELSTPLTKVYNTLTLLTILEGSSGLFRLNGIVAHREFWRLKWWFTKDSLAAWNDLRNREEVFELYHDSIVHLARSIGTALGRPWIDVQSHREKTSHHDPCFFELRELNFPPLSKSNGNEPIFALLPALVEPLINALRYLKEQTGQSATTEWEREPVKLVIEDRRDNSNTPHILVRIGNRCYDRNVKVPSGVKNTRHLMKMTRLATMIWSEARDGYQWVTIRLHPQKLHLKIQQEESKAEED